MIHNSHRHIFFERLLLLHIYSLSLSCAYRVCSRADRAFVTQSLIFFAFKFQLSFLRLALRTEIKIMGSKILSLILISLIGQRHVNSASNSCGFMSHSTGLIQGGEFSSTLNFPWIANIFTRFNGVWLYAGSGTLISDRFLLCAANSVAYENYLKGKLILNPDKNYIAYNGSDIKLLFGAERYKGFDEENSLTIEGVEKVILHPDLKGTKPRIANIALLKFKNPINFTPYVQPACIMDDENNIDSDHNYSQMYSVGHGVDESGSISVRRKQIAMTHTSDEICHRFFKKAFDKLQKNLEFFCARGNGYETPCKHDKALYVKINGQWYLKAMSSMFKLYRNNTCSVKAPVLYEDMAPFSHWIHQTMLE